MPRLVQRFATPLITGLFLVSLISGIALFFHVGPGAFHSMHEWLSMVLILPFVLHIWRNLRPLLAYLRRPPMFIALGLSVVMAAYFFVPSGSEAGRGGRPPQFALAQQVMAATPADVAPILHTAPAALVAKLKAAGYSGAAADKSLTDIAKTSGKTAAELAGVLTRSDG